MRLLLAEDEVALSHALTALLIHSNYSVDAVYDGQEALDYLESGIYDAVADAKGGWHYGLKEDAGSW